MYLRKRNQILVIIFTTAVLLLVLGCSQQAVSENSYPVQTEVAEASFEKMTQLDWDGYSKLLHTDALNRFRGTIIPQIEKLVIMTSADSISFFGRNLNSQEIQSMPADSFFAKIMNIVTDISPDIKTTFSTILSKTVGAVEEGDTLVHVIVRNKITLGGQDIEEMNIQTVRLDGEAWKIDLSSKIGGVAMMISQGIEYQLGNTGR